MGVSGQDAAFDGNGGTPRFAQRMRQTTPIHSNVDDDTSSRPFYGATHPTPSDTSPSSSHVSEESVFRDGKCYLSSFLTSRSRHGITANPFCDDVNVLRSILDSYGLSHLGSCRTATSCRTLLFRHVFSGDCVARANDARPPTACQYFSRGHASPSSLSKEAFLWVSISNLLGLWLLWWVCRTRIVPPLCHTCHIWQSRTHVRRPSRLELYEFDKCCSPRTNNLYEEIRCCNRPSGTYSSPRCVVHWV